MPGDLLYLVPGLYPYRLALASSMKQPASPSSPSTTASLTGTKRRREDDSPNGATSIESSPQDQTHPTASQQRGTTRPRAKRPRTSSMAPQALNESTTAPRPTAARDAQDDSSELDAATQQDIAAQVSHRSPCLSHSINALFTRRISNS